MTAPILRKLRSLCWLGTPLAGCATPQAQVDRPVRPQRHPGAIVAPAPRPLRDVPRPSLAQTQPQRVTPAELDSPPELAVTEPIPQPSIVPVAAEETLVPAPEPAVEAVDIPLASRDYPQDNVAGTLSLDEILGLARSQNPNIALAQERINEAYARVDRAEALWLPSLRAGMNYNHHEGRIQDVAGNVIETSRGSWFGGLGASAVGAGSPAVPGLVASFHLTDAAFQPQIAAHQAESRHFAAAATRNNVLRDTAVAYLELLRAEQGVIIAQEARDQTARLHDLTRQFAESGTGLTSDQFRPEAELAIREEQLVAQKETRQVASARLAQLLHTDPACQIIPAEPAVVPLDMINSQQSTLELVAQGLSCRPELAQQQHLVCEAVARWKREQYAPLVPSVMLGMSYGGMAGGLGGSMANGGDRWDADAVAYWELRNLGFGDQAAQHEAQSASRQAQLRQVALLDQVAREVQEAHAQVEHRHERLTLAKRGITAAEKSYSLNQQRIENAQGLPIESLQSIQALATARRAYLNAVIDYNIAQIELCRATGWFAK